ncbi:DUF1772 domain-containing protein [Gordonia polyisoprenivorans]|uniref:DUF1772 domain-containing protein n=1 Tax=Gordonia polyisoprenivorans TaxID=84595 RepID=UPI0030CC136B
MPTSFIQSAIAISVMTNAVIYGIDVFSGLIMRPVYTRVDTATMTVMAGLGHHYGDKRLPIVGITGYATAVAAMIAAFVTGHSGTALWCTVAVAALTVWLALYAFVAKPINTRQTGAALSGVIPSDAEELQERWDSVMPARIALQTVALAALVIALAI